MLLEKLEILKKSDPRAAQLLLEGLVQSIAEDPDVQLLQAERAAMATLGNVAGAQAQKQASGAICVDGDGADEYGTFAELSGGCTLRGTQKTMNPPVLSSSFRRVQRGAVERAGYFFAVYLPDASGQGLAENYEGGAHLGLFQHPPLRFLEAQRRQVDHGLRRSEHDAGQERAIAEMSAAAVAAAVRCVGKRLHTGSKELGEDRWHARDRSGVLWIREHRLYRTYPPVPASAMPWLAARRSSVEETLRARRWRVRPPSSRAALLLSFVPVAFAMHGRASDGDPAWRSLRRSPG